MRDRIAILAGVSILVLGILVLFTPQDFIMRLEFLPLPLAATIVLALGLLVLVVGLVSFLAERL